MKLNLSVLKNVLMCGDEGDEIDMWIKDNIGDGDVSVREWLDEFGKYFDEWADDFGDSRMIVEILVNDYKLSEDECNIVMKEYWGESEFSYNYNDYKM